MRTNAAAIVLAALALLGTACNGSADDEPAFDIANPASVYCEEHGGTLEIRTGDDGAQTGSCVFPDGSECDEWAYFRGECAPGS